MYATMEVRWFHRGMLPADVVTWFQQGERCPVEPAQRVDHYLRVAEGASLGIKLREGHIEIKQRHQQFGMTQLHLQVSGLVEHWRKWSLPLIEPNDQPGHVAQPASDWIGVYKERRLQRYRITNGAELIAIPATHYPDQGCDLELTRVQASDRTWWTLSFEAFGDESVLQQNFALATKRILGRADPPVLGVEDSYGYPRWLQILSEDGK